MFYIVPSVGMFRWEWQGHESSGGFSACVDAARHAAMQPGPPFLPLQLCLSEEKKKDESFEPRTLHLSTPASTLVLSPRCPLFAGLRAPDGDGCVLLTKASAVWRLWSSPSFLLALLYRTSQGNRLPLPSLHRSIAAAR
jgi:hypothetical protein